MARCIVVGAVLVVLAACAESPTLVASGEALAALGVIDTTAEHRPLTATVFTVADDGLPLDEGDTVRTDASGFAEVLYADGSLTRLDADTIVTVLTLDGDVTVPQVELDLDVGRIWNRVNTVTGERGRFEVVTDVGTAAVRGTAFAVECTPAPLCTFTVTEGVVVVTTPDGREIEIRAGQVVTLGQDDGGDAAADGAGDGGDDSGGGPTTVEVSRTALDPDASTGAAAWAARNLGIDDATGRFDPARQRCAVTLGGRNLAHASTPGAAIEAPIDEPLQLDAVATGPLDRYAVDLVFGTLAIEATSGVVQADASGDRTTFRGDVDVAEYAAWGVGLYEVRARTTGTECSARAFVRVTGRPPLTTVTGLLAILLVLGGSLGVGAAFRVAGGGSLPPLLSFLGPKG